MRQFLFVAVLFPAPLLHAALPDEAMLYFAGDTNYVEYDNLGALRNLSAYQSLKKAFAGKTLEEAQDVLQKLGIREDEVNEVVIGSNRDIFYGLLTGSFSGDLIRNSAKSRRYGTKLTENAIMYCAGQPTCIVFLDNATAAFGRSLQLKQIVLAREGRVAGMGTNSHPARLLQLTDRNAPVRGVVFGSELQSTLKSVLGDWGRWKSQQDQLASTMTALAYSVSFNYDAHVVAHMECASATSASLFSHLLGSIGSVQSMTGTNTGLPFRNVKASSSDNVILFEADTRIPTGT